MKHFLRLGDFSAAELRGLVEDAIRVKRETPGDLPLAGKSVALVFMNPSLRTRVSFETATHRLGGHPVTLSPGESSWTLEFEDGSVMDGGATEHAKEAARVLSRMCAAIAIRSFPEGKDWARDEREPALSAFAKYATVPVINMESATGHPCQALADWMTVAERMRPKGRKFLLTWAPHTKALPLAVPQSAAEMALAAGMELTIARPAGFDLSPAAMAALNARAAETGASLTVTDDLASAYDGASVVYAKSWGSLEAYGTPPDAALRADWIVDAEKMTRTDSALFMHCLPVRRNLVAADAVLDGPGSVVIDQAENRLYTAEAVLRRACAAAPVPAGA